MFLLSVDSGVCAPVTAASKVSKNRSQPAAWHGFEPFPGSAIHTTRLCQLGIAHTHHLVTQTEGHIAVPHATLSPLPTMQPTGDGNGNSSNSGSSHPGAEPSAKPEQQQQPAAPAQQQRQWQYLPPPSNVVEIDDVQVTPIDDPFYDPTNPSSNFDRSSRDASSTAAGALRDSQDPSTAAGAQHPSTNAVAIDDVDFEGFAAPLLDQQQEEAGGLTGFPPHRQPVN